MKTAHCCLIFLGASMALCLPTGGAYAQTSGGSLLPTNRHVENILPEERNPFGQAVEIKEEVLVVEKETEETRLRNILGAAPIQGIIQSGETYEMMMGPLTLRVGDTLPSLLPNQTERVKVLRVTETEAIFGFVERDGTAQTRTLSRRVDFAPEVRYLLPSQSPATTAPPSSNGLEGVMPRESDDALLR